jgi:integrase
MRRNVIQEQPPPQFPISVKKGHATVKIYRVKNRDRTHYTVSYVTTNGRARRSFADLELARTEATTVAHNLAGGDLEALKLTGRERQMYVAAEQATARTGLTLDSAAREFARAFDILGHGGIVEAARYYKAHVETGLPDVPVTQAVEKFADAKRKEGMSAIYLKDIRTILGRFASHFQCNIASIVPEDLRDYLNAKHISPVAKNNHRRLIVVLFNFAKAQRWLRPNEQTAADVLGIYNVKERDVEIYTPAEVARLINAAGPDFLPYLALIAFGGVRREELHKGLQWEAINFDRGYIIVSASVAKTGRKRKIDMTENLLEWLLPYRVKSGAIFKTDPRKRIAKVVAASGVKWKRNALRHSFGSYRMEQTKNAGQVALEMGNSAAVVMKHYFEIVDARAAREYWSIKPLPATDRKIVNIA